MHDRAKEIMMLKLYTRIILLQGCYRDILFRKIQRLLLSSLRMQVSRITPSNYCMVVSRTDSLAQKVFVTCADGFKEKLRIPAKRVRFLWRTFCLR